MVMLHKKVLSFFMLKKLGCAGMTTKFETMPHKEVSLLLVVKELGCAGTTTKFKTMLKIVIILIASFCFIVL